MLAKRACKCERGACGVLPIWRESGEKDQVGTPFGVHACLRTRTTLLPNMRRSSASASRYLGSKEYNCIEPKSFMRRSALPLRVAKCSTTTPDDRGTHLFDLEPLGICANRLLRAFRRHLCLARAILDREFRQRAIDLVHPIVSYRRRSCCRLAPLLLFLVAGLGRSDRRCVGRRRRVDRSGAGRVESRSGRCRLLLLFAVRLLGLLERFVSPMP